MNQSKREPRGQIRRSKEEGRRLVERWRASGVSAPVFCRQNGVAQHVLYYWARQNSGSNAQAAAPADFFVMRAEPPAVADDVGSHAASRAIVIVVPLGSKAGGLAETLRAVLGEVIP
jgi:transposase-like protein